WRRLVARCIGFHARNGAWAQKILNPLIVPILARRHLAVLCAPVDQLLFGVEAEVDEPACDDGIDHEQGRAVLLYGCETVTHLLLPCGTRPITGLRIPAAKEDGRHAVRRLEPFLHMQRLPRAALF